MEHGGGELIANSVDALAGQQQVQTVVGGIIAADRRPRLDRRRHDAIVDELNLDDMDCRRKRRAGRLRVSPLKAETEISWGLVPEHWCAWLQRRQTIDDCVQRLVFDDDALRGVTRLLATRRDD